MKKLSILTLGGCLCSLVACGSSSSTTGGTGGTAGGNNCNFGEPNNTRETATPVVLNQSYAGICVGGPSDPTDFFEITAPATDLAGGFVQVLLRNVGGRSPEMEGWAVADNGQMFDDYTTVDGANLDDWFTVAPGGKYRVDVHQFAGSSDLFTYDVQFKYTPIVDTFEPNNARESAKTIALGTPVMASATVAALGGDVAKTEQEDWYAVTLAPGAATVVLSNVPADVSCDVTAYDPDGNSVDEKYNTTDGANCKLELTDLTTAGVYKIKVEAFGGPPPRTGKGVTPPQSVTGQYTLLATQP